MKQPQRQVVGSGKVLGTTSVAPNQHKGWIIAWLSLFLPLLNCCFQFAKRLLRRRISMVIQRVQHMIDFEKFTRRIKRLEDPIRGNSQQSARGLIWPKWQNSQPWAPAGQ